MNLIKADSGLLCIRQLGGGNFAIVGCVYFPESFKPAECAQYLATTTDGLQVSEHTIDDAPLGDDYRGAGLNHLLRCPVWRGTSEPGSFTFRLYQAFPENNGWVLFGASQHAPTLDQSYERGHAWVEISDQLKTLSPEWSGQEIGKQPGQLLDLLPVWPGPDSQRYVLPAIDQATRGHYFRYAQLKAAIGDGELTQAELENTVLQDRDLDPFRHSHDEAYCRYLAVLQRMGGLTLSAPATATDFQAREQRASQAIKVSMIEDRALWPAAIAEIERKKGLVTSAAQSPSP